MSSHHIIRDEQEPPVLVFQINENWDELSEILGWSPILLISPILEQAFQLRQTKIDGYLINRKDAVDNTGKDIIFEESNVIDSILNWINTKDCTAVNIFCDNEMMTEFYSQLKTRDFAIPILFFTEKGKFILKPNSKYRKWYPENFKIDILNEDIKVIENLKSEIDGYLVEKAGFVTIQVEGNLVLVKEK